MRLTRDFGESRMREIRTSGSTRGRESGGHWFVPLIPCFPLYSTPTALLRSEVLPRWGRLRMPAYYRSCGQSGDYPEGQIYQQEINGKRRPPVQPEISRAAHRQKEQEQCQQRSKEV